jgi:hypothetical protein
MHRLRTRLTYANAMATIAVFIALGGGAYAAVSSIPGPDGVIHGCYAKRRGNLRLVPAGRRCARSERAIAFTETGPPGLRGSRGATGAKGTAGAKGATGLKGEQGPAGPGASTFSTTLAQPGEATLAILSNGVTIKGSCQANTVSLSLLTTSGLTSLQLSGSDFSGGALNAADVAGSAGSTVSGPTYVDFDVLGRDSSAGKFARIDVHGSYGSPCAFWGMVVPSG